MKHLSRFTKREISELFKKARRPLRHPSLDILCAPTVVPTGKILVITPKRVGKAAKRNRIRRRLKSIFLEEKLFERGFDCIVIVKQQAIDFTFEQLKEILLSAFAKATADRV